MADPGDDELIERYRAGRDSPGGRVSIDELFQRHHAQVAAWCYRMTGSIDLSADLAQEIFLKAFQRLDTYRGASKFTTWLYSIARNHCMDELRSRAVRPSETTKPVLDDVADTGAEQILVTLERRESQSAVRQLIEDSLDDTEAKVMTLHFVDDLPLDAITRLMGLANQSGAKAYIVSAKRKLSRAAIKWRARQSGAL